MLKARGGLDKGFYYQICPSADSTAKDTLYSQIKAVCFTGHVPSRYFYGLQCKETGSEPSEQQRYCFHKMRYWYVFVCAAIWTRFISKRNHGGGDRSALNGEKRWRGWAVQGSQIPALLVHCGSHSGHIAQKDEGHAGCCPALVPGTYLRDPKWVILEETEKFCCQA